MRQLLTIGLGTMNRPVMLRQALESLIALKLPEKMEVQLVVCENGNSIAGKEVFEEVSKRIPFNCFFIQEQSSGIVFMRNAILNWAIDQKSDFLAFYDDDEIVSQDWIVRLNATRIKYGADIVQGHLEQHFPEVENVELIRKFFPGSFPKKTGDELHEAYTGNVMFDLSLVRRYQIRFNERFNKIGGSDSVFFSQLKEKGAKIVFDKGAIVTETVPPSRANVDWLLARAFRNGYAMYHLNVTNKGKLKAIRKAIRATKTYLKTENIKLIHNEGDFLKQKKRMQAKGMMNAMLGRSFGEYDVIHGG